MSEEMAKKIRDLRKQNNLTLEQVADIVGVGKSTVRKWETGMIANMRRDKIAALAKALKTTPAYLMGWEEETGGAMVDLSNPIPLGQLVNLRVVASVRAGYDGEVAPEYEEEYITIPKFMLRGYPENECVIYRVTGDSMYPKILDGDLAIVHLQTSVDSGQTAVIVYDEDAGTLKKVRYVTGEDWMELIPANPEYQTKRVDGTDIKKCRVYGHVIGIHRVID